MSILTNVLLVVIKTAVALISGSLAVTADAIHPLSDVVSSAIVLVGMKISECPAHGFPYGLYKVENLIALATSVLIYFAGYEIIKTIVIAPARPLPKNIPLAVTGIGSAILITWLFPGMRLEKVRKADHRV